jgi:hypothetical protein
MRRYTGETAGYGFASNPPLLSPLAKSFFANSGLIEPAFKAGTWSEAASIGPAVSYSVDSV